MGRACLQALQLGAGEVEAVQVGAAAEAEALQRLADQPGLAQASIAVHHQRPAQMIALITLTPPRNPRWANSQAASKTPLASRASSARNGAATKVMHLPKVHNSVWATRHRLPGNATQGDCLACCMSMEEMGPRPQRVTHFSRGQAPCRPLEVRCRPFPPSPMVRSMSSQRDWQARNSASCR